MLLSSLVLLPIMGIFSIVVRKFTSLTSISSKLSTSTVKYIALTASILNLFLSIILFILFDFSTNQFQFVQEYHNISYFDFFLGIDGLSIYFVLLTTIIVPISLLSNWKSMDLEYYFIIILLLESLLLLVFLVLDILLFYIFFESILPPLFLLIGLFGSDNRIKAGFYLFLYTLLGSLFLLLSILGMSSIMSATDFDSLFKKNFLYLTQVFLFYGIFIAFAVKTPTIFLNTWLLKAHVESPLGGSIILAAIVLKLSLYGILRLILPVLPKAFMVYTCIVFLIGVITIVYASISTLRTIDVKELIAYSSVSHAAVYLVGLFSNSLQGIEGGISLGLAHGYISPGLFIVAGGVLYDRYHTRLISFYKGMTQQLPLLSLLFFILCLGNCGAPLTLNFVGEFMSLYGVFERSSLFGVFASSSIVFSAAYTINMYQKISFGGQFTLATKEDELVVKIEDKLATKEDKLEVKTDDKLEVKIDDILEVETNNIVKPDINERECIVFLPLIVLPVILGIYAAPILDAIHFSSSSLLYMFDSHNFIYATAIFIASYNTSVPQVFSVYLRILKDKTAPGLKWALYNPPKPHAFTSLPLQSEGNSWKAFLSVLVFLGCLEVNHYLETINIISNPVQTIFLLYILSSLMAVFWMLAYSYLLDLYTKFIQSSITRNLKNLVYELKISWRLLLISEKIVVLYYMFASLYFFLVVLFYLYSGCFILLDGMSNISHYNWSELFCAPMELVSGGDGQSMSGIVPGLEDKESLALNSSTNPNRPPQGPANTEGIIADTYHRERIANCPGHNWSHSVTVSPQEYARSNVPDCDFNVTRTGGRDHTHLAVDPAKGQHTFFTCSDCPAVACDECAIK